MPARGISGRADDAHQGATDMTDPVESRPRRRGPGVGLILLGFAAIAGITVLLLALLTNIFERRQEARQPFLRGTEVTRTPSIRRSGVRTGRSSTTATYAPRSPPPPSMAAAGPGREMPGPLRRSSTATPGSSASLRATPSPWTIATGAVTPLPCLTRRRPSG